MAQFRQWRGTHFGDRQHAISEPGGEARPEDVRVLLVGPEGGFDPAEIAAARAAGARTVDLGPGILRAETAALVGAARMVAHTTR